MVESEEQMNLFVPVIGKDEVCVDMSESLDFGGFQVVRREFFAHIHEPSITFNSCKFYVNAACLNKFPQADFIQVLVNRET